MFRANPADGKIQGSSSLMRMILIAIWFGGASACWGFASPVVALLGSGLVLFFVMDAHVGLLLVQLEFLSLAALVFILSKSGAHTPMVLMALLCLMVAEAALGLSILTLNSRAAPMELQKFNY